MSQVEVKSEPAALASGGCAAQLGSCGGRSGSGLVAALDQQRHWRAQCEARHHYNRNTEKPSWATMCRLYRALRSASTGWAPRQKPLR
jgi:hypothetical protein